MIDLLAPGFLYSLGKDVWARIFSRRRKLSTSEVVELRKKWKAEFEPRIWDTHKNKLRQDVIIRDMKRIDNYPDIDDNNKSKKCSPWFRAALVGTYHRGIYVGQTWEKSWPDKLGQLDKWSFCLTTAKMAVEQERR
jgi:hypothetical protein